ncbi:MAG: hypothetical protein ACJZ0Y_01715 [Cytophagales bacterium]|nr:hypothetical protein [Cytophagales bacterium]PDH42687.1 MAG: hypothetical protein CND83_01595 [Rhodothermaeota bacterium MED-G19]|tara:strand:+ start:3465 stop:4181 length:717 start_codon:yes stop_codon:yes gene_type:complete
MKFEGKKIQSYGVESLVILFSIILSFYIEGQRDLNNKRLDKNKLITDLINTIDEDLNQLNYINKVVMGAVKNFNEILLDIDSENKTLSRSEIMTKMIANNIGISFFPQEGIFNQLIATGSFELIENQELKSLLLEIYNHQNNRNYATSYQIDLFSIKFNERVYNNFRLNTEYNYREGEIYGRPIVKSYTFNEKYYFSNEFYGLLSEGKQNGNDYIRLLDDISENYKQARIYAQYEIKD